MFSFVNAKFFLLTLIFLKKHSDFFQNSFFFFFFLLKKTQMFSKLRVFFFKTQRFFFGTQVFFKELFFFLFKIQFKQCACHIPVDHDCWLKQNEQNGVDDQNGFICFMLHFVPFTCNELNASVHSCDIREL